MKETRMNGKMGRGFSLVELMVVLAIIGILASIAIPNYNAYLVKANRASAQQFMMTIANKEEQYLLDNRAYTATIGVGGLGLTPPAELNGKYTFPDPVVTTSPPTYTITAQASGSQVSDGNLTLDSSGYKTRNGSPGW